MHILFLNYGPPLTAAVAAWGIFSLFFFTLMML